MAAPIKEDRKNRTAVRRNVERSGRLGTTTHGHKRRFTNLW